jgi:hypothetical protein
MASHFKTIGGGNHRWDAREHFFASPNRARARSLARYRALTVAGLKRLLRENKREQGQPRFFW